MTNPFATLWTPIPLYTPASASRRKFAHMLWSFLGREFKRDVAHARLDKGAIGTQLGRALGGKASGPRGRPVTNRHRFDRDAFFRLPFRRPPFLRIFCATRIPSLTRPNTS